MIINIGQLHSGTRYMSKLLQAYGFDVGHERVGSDGISSCELASTRMTKPHSAPMEAWDLWEQRDDQTLAPTVIYTVREPVANLLSILADTDERWDQYRRLFGQECELDGDRFQQAMQLMVHWHKLCFLTRSPDFIVPLEDAPGRIAAWILNELEINLRCDESALPPKDDHTKGLSNIHWTDLDETTIPDPLREQWHELVAFHWMLRRGWTL